ncbi:MAG: DUF4440 domain-containing protein [Planctomycetia bacterium]|nr:DUF4440 domain-containing protein [Planctomycetia bacterium]
MSRNSDSGAAVVVTAIVLLALLLMAVGGGVYVWSVRSQSIAAVAQAERARAEEAVAKLQAERSRVQAGPTQANPTSPKSSATPIDGDEAVRAAVETVLRTQEQAWNDGNLDGFMEHYWKSDALTFSSGGETTRGWTATLNRYQARYPTRETMGRLTLSEFEITPLGDSAALVLGGWQVARDSEPLAGNFSLVTRKIDGRWVVVHDHTSRKTE